MTTLVIKTAEEFKTLDSLERQASRRAGRETPLVQQIFRLFVDNGGPIPVADIAAAFSDSPAAAIHDTLGVLDDADLIRVRDGFVDIAYPLSASPTAFVVRLPGGRERYACCAMDALGLAPMLGQPVQIRSRCHHCGMPLDFSATPSGPGSDAEGVMTPFSPSRAFLTAMGQVPHTSCLRRRALPWRLRGRRSSWRTRVQTARGRSLVTCSFRRRVIRF